MISSKKTGRKGQQPEALAQFAKSARTQPPAASEATVVADAETSPIAEDNAEKHGVAETLLHEGASGREPDPETAGAKQLPDRILDSRPKSGILRRLRFWN